MPSSASIPPGPIVLSACSSTAASTRFNSTKPAATVGPPSTSSRVMPSPASTRSISWRSSRPCVSSTRKTLQPFSIRNSSARPEALRDANTQVGVSRTVDTTVAAIGSRSLASSTTRTGERSNRPGKRQVSCGLSDSTVPMPTKMASVCARIWNTRSRAASPLSATGLRPASPTLPSLDSASLSVTKGRPCRMQLMCPAWARAASSAQRPTSTVMPFSRSRAWPCPATSVLGSSSAETTRATPALMMASAHGGVLP